jgi:hypothetical protein
MSLLLFADVAHAQDGATPPPAVEVDLLKHQLSAGVCAPGQCCPPTGATTAMIVAGDVALLLLSGFLFVRLMERRYIANDLNPLLGRHLGVSISLLFATFGMAVLQYGATGCFAMSSFLWIGVAFAAFLVHAFYTAVVVRAS